MRLQTLILTFVAAFATQTQAQPFQDLNFEAAVPVFDPDGYYPWDVTAASALPGWTVTLGGVQQSDVWFDQISTGAPSVDLVSSFAPSFVAPPLDGNYSVVLQAYNSIASISQSGLIPGGTQSLLFAAFADPSVLAVSVNGQTLPFYAVSVGTSYTIYGANVSAWAGNVAQITFSEVGLTSEFAELDDIQFSPNAIVPEPSPLALATLGGLAFVLLRKARRRTSGLPLI